MPEIRGDRSIRNIPIPASHKRHMHEHEEELEQEEEIYEEQPRRRRSRNGGRRLFWLILIIVVILAGIGGVLLSTVFVGASVKVTQKTAHITAPSSIAAALNPASGGLAYQVATISRTASTSVQANGTQQVSRSASGIITIYNNYSTQSQDLVANTRFSTTDGKIYRIHQATTVPGGKKNADGTLTPGSVSITAYADKPGADYNIGSAQLSIPGFKGDSRYGGFYAKTDGMTGGLVGQEPAVASSTLAQAQTALKQGLQSALQNASASDVPANFMEVPGTLQVSYESIVESANQDGSVTLSQSASASVDVVRQGDLAAALARQLVQGYSGEAVDFIDPTQLAISLAPGSSPGQGSLTLNLSGTPTLVWQFDPSTLKAALVGKPKSQFQSILQSFAPAIDCSEATPCSASIRPFWESSFPSNPAKISVVATPAQ